MLGNRYIDSELSTIVSWEVKIVLQSVTEFVASLL